MSKCDIEHTFLPDKKKGEFRCIICGYRIRLKNVKDVETKDLSNSRG